MEYTIKVKMDNGKEAVVHCTAKTSEEAFERAKLTYPNWQNLHLEQSYEPSKFDLDEFLGDDTLD